MRTHPVTKKVSETFKKHMEALGLLSGDNQWKKTMAEAAFFQSAKKLRVLFVSLLTNCEITDPCSLYEDFRLELCDDMTNKRRRDLRDHSLPPNGEDEAYAVADIDNMLSPSDKSLQDIINGTGSITLPTCNVGHMSIMTEEEQHCSLEVLVRPGTAESTTFELERQLEEDYESFQPEQKEACDAIIEDVKAAMDPCTPTREHCHWIAGRGGCGKTFLNEYLLRRIRSLKTSTEIPGTTSPTIALALASSGIASLLLQGGRTVHSRLKVPLQIGPDGTLGIRKHSSLHRLITRAAFILWDEATMQSKYVLEAIDKTFRDLMENDVPFGGKVCVSLWSQFSMIFYYPVCTFPL